MFHSMTRRAAVGLTGALALGCLSGAALADGKLGSPDWDYEIVLGGGSATGNSRVLAGALGKIVTENVQGVRASGAVSPGFDAESAIHVHDGSFQGGVGTPLIIANAVNGVPPFPKEGIALKFWFYHNEVPLNVLARTDTGFTKISDLKGATVAMAPRGTSNYQLSEIVFGNEGVSLDDVRIRYMDTSEAISQLQNGNIDAMSYVRDYSGAVLELTTARDITLLQPSEEGAAKTSEKLEWSGPIDWPFVKEYASMNVPAPGQAFVSPEFMFLDADLPDDLVYAMTRAVWENIEVVNRSSKVFAHVNLQEALKRVPIAPHPGAIRYYKEMNVPGWEKYADLLPAE